VEGRGCGGEEESVGGRVGVRNRRREVEGRRGA